MQNELKTEEQLQATAERAVKELLPELFEVVELSEKMNNTLDALLVRLQDLTNKK